MLSDITGAIGVSLLLLAFAMNLFGKWKLNSRAYITLNLAGAAIACFASVLIHYVPFIVLEGAWTLVALFAFIKKLSLK